MNRLAAFFILLLIPFSVVFPEEFITDSSIERLTNVIENRDLPAFKRMILSNELYNYTDFKTNDRITRINDLAYFYGFLSGVFQNIESNQFDFYRSIAKDKELALIMNFVPIPLNFTESDGEGYCSDESYSNMIVNYAALAPQFKNTYFISDFALATNDLYKMTYSGHGYFIADKYQASGFCYGLSSIVSSILNGDESLDAVKNYAVIPLSDDKDLRVIYADEKSVVYGDILKNLFVILKKEKGATYLMNSALDVKKVYMIAGVSSYKGRDYILIRTAR